MEGCLLAGRKALQPLPPQLGQLLLRLVRPVVELLVVGDGDGVPVVGVTQDVGQVGADGNVEAGVGVPRVLAALVGVEEIVKTRSPVVLRLLLTPPVRPVQVGHHLLLDGQDVGLVFPATRHYTSVLRSESINLRFRKSILRTLGMVSCSMKKENSPGGWRNSLMLSSRDLSEEFFPMANLRA